eukprot:5297390-Alexandrium_andersonii.AAC.1
MIFLRARQSALAAPQHHTCRHCRLAAILALRFAQQPALATIAQYSTAHAVQQRSERAAPAFPHRQGFWPAMAQQWCLRCGYASCMHHARNRT